MTPLVISDLTTGGLAGTGVFDKMMAANKAHLEAEYQKDRIKGPEYAQVYLGTMDTTMNAALQFLLQSRRLEVELALIEQQVLLAQVEVLKAQVELEILEANKEKIAAEVIQLTAQTALTEQQTLNAVIEGTVLTAQECKLRAEYDLLLGQNLKTAAEVVLLGHKSATEKAQISPIGVDDNSVVGKQKLLYQAQTEGFTRDAEQKAAKIMIDTWNARRMTDEGTVADNVNKLNDSAIGRAVDKLLTGVNA